MKGFIRHIIILLVIIHSFSIVQAQEETRKYSINGYVSSLQSVIFDTLRKNWTTGDLFHNRVNLNYFPTSNFTANIELRNRLVIGDSIGSGQSLKSYENDNGYMRLSKNIVHGNSYIFNAFIDRVLVAYEKGKLRATLGRQRVNWGQTLVWNPNDIFNTYSFFDFDYIERPGSDALRVQYFNTEVSEAELAIKIDKQKKITSAALYKFNKWAYDFQILGGILNSDDYTIGMGWSGAIKSLAFRGEATYFRPIEKFSDTTGISLFSVSFDYTFGNSLFLLAEYLFSNNVLSGNVSFQQFYTAPLTVKSLTFVKHNLVVQSSYPITPLLTGSFATMYMPGIKGYYVGPSLSYSLAQNLEVSLNVQSFNGKINKFVQRFNLLFFRMKMSF